MRYVMCLVLGLVMAVGTALCQPPPPEPIFEVFGPISKEQVKGESFTAWGLCNVNDKAITVWFVDANAKYLGKKQAVVLNGFWFADFQGHAPSEGAKRFIFADNGLKTTPSVEFTIK